MTYHTIIITRQDIYTEEVDGFLEDTNSVMDALRNRGAKKISVQYLTDTRTQAINKAIITYLI